VGRIDVFGEKVCFRESDGGNLRIIRMVQPAPEIRRFEHTPILFEKTLVIAEMIRIDLEVITNIRLALWARDLADLTSVYRDTNSALRSKNVMSFC